MPAGLRIAVTLAVIFGMSGLVSAQAAEPADSCPTIGGCQVEDGLYRIVLPPQAASGARSGAILYFHGYQGSADETIGDKDLVAMAQRLGVALIAADGVAHSWSYPGSPARYRDEFAYVGHVLDDVSRRFPIDLNRIIASGFSQGGSMVWYLACRMPRRFAGFAPIAGAFWEPLPQECAGPRPNLIHVHGTNDPTVPLAGRALRGGAKQGDVFKSLGVIAAKGCTASWVADAPAAAIPPELSCRLAHGCAGDARLELCLHAGGHIADASWIARAWALLTAPDPARSKTGAKLILR